MSCPKIEFLTSTTQFAYTDHNEAVAVVGQLRFVRPFLVSCAAITVCRRNAHKMFLPQEYFHY